jgi:hypothetical protein
MWPLYSSGNRRTYCKRGHGPTWLMFVIHAPPTNIRALYSLAMWYRRAYGMFVSPDEHVSLCLSGYVRLLSSSGNRRT